MRELLIRQLIPTHNRLRSPHKMWEIYQWQLKNNKKVCINRTRGADYIHDGHHRMVLDYWLGNTVLREYNLTKFTAHQYNQVNFEQEWVTPFGLENYVRVPDFGVFKDIALAKRDVEFIYRCRSVYVENRVAHNLLHLAELYKPEIYFSKDLKTESEKYLDLPQSTLYAMVRLAGTNMVLGGATRVGKAVTTACLSNDVEVKDMMEVAIGAVQ